MRYSFITDIFQFTVIGFYCVQRCRRQRCLAGEKKTNLLSDFNACIANKKSSSNISHYHKQPWKKRDKKSKCFFFIEFIFPKIKAEEKAGTEWCLLYLCIIYWEHRNEFI